MVMNVPSPRIIRLGPLPVPGAICVNKVCGGMVIKVIEMHLFSVCRSRLGLSLAFYPVSLIDRNNM